MTPAEIEKVISKAREWMGDDDILSLCELPPEEIAAAVIKVEAENKPLNPRQKAFVREYLSDLNATNAAIRAGYSPDTAGSIGSRLLKEVNVAAAVARAQAQRAQRVGMTQHDVLHEMSMLANSSVEHYCVSDDGYLALAPGAPEGAMRAVSSVKRKLRIYKDSEGNESYREYEVEFRLWDKPGTLKLTGRHVGLYADRMEITGKDGGPLEVSRVIREIVDPKALKE